MRLVVGFVLVISNTTGDTNKARSAYLCWESEFTTGFVGVRISQFIFHNAVFFGLVIMLFLSFISDFVLTFGIHLYSYIVYI